MTIASDLNLRALSVDELRSLRRRIGQVGKRSRAAT